ncbi:hypothetical protein [Nocardioides dongkuii]|uniref:hypothetical protein n=1 Tax=Nocardioides dongkuii TaxID=2760089 RepID=UPI0015FA8387|nr:hypothetical protein [Nocardioides dongkuii]
MTRPLPSPVPHGRTARRLEWAHLPPHVRALVERECGSPVVAATSQGGGYTPGFASVLECADGSRHFVKAASVLAQRSFALSYREEARKLAALPPEAPAPRLLWLHDREDWVVLGIEHVDGGTPPRPWRPADLEAAAAVLERMVPVLTPPPAELELDPLAEDLADWPAAWDHLRATRPDLPHLDEAAGLAAGFAAVTAGDTLVHTDVRDDNLLLAADGRVLLCDWNWPAVGAPWLDTVMLMIGPRGDGLDVDALLARLPLTRDVPREHVDVLLALLVGYFWRQADERVPPTSPYLRDFQRWQGDVVWDWLAERRGWS